MHWLVVISTLSSMLILTHAAEAEPWLANRFAQNCAGCHAPGRKNLPPADRRCTLTCQGCHVNPNGGGLRSAYGKWNEDRWLYTVRSELLAKKRRPAPYPKQKYASTAKKGKKAEGKSKKNKAKPRRMRRQGTPFGEPASLVEAVKDLPESEYDRSDGLEHVTAASYDEFLHQVPIEDPIYQLLENKVDGGADLRWQVVRGTFKRSSASGTSKQELWASFLMNVDLALRYRPIYKRYHLVYEGRYLGNPTVNRTDQAMQTLTKRSLYLLVDDLPFATFAMAGYYRPLFGNYVPDHTTLAQKMQSYALQESPTIYGLNYEALTLGGSPNVPFLNLHVVSRQYGPGANDTHRGYAANIGGRFVTLGASVNYSFWASEKDEVIEAEKVNTRVQMHSLSGGLAFWRIIANMEILALSKDRPNDAFSKGLVATFDTFYRIYGETYLTLSYAQSNISESLRPGSAQQFRVGARAFITQGVETMLIWNSEKNKITDAKNTAIPPSDTVTDEILWQLHLFI